MTCPDFAEALQARICADLEAEKIAHTPLKYRLADGQRSDKVLELRTAALEEALAKAESLGEQRAQDAETAAKRVDHLVVELVAMTGEFVGMSKRVAEQTAAMDKLRAELDYYRSRS